jgi:hypothetical protein
MRFAPSVDPDQPTARVISTIVPKRVSSGGR